MPNIFTDSGVCELGVTFMASGRKFSYDFKYDVQKEEYIYDCVDEDVQAMIPIVSKNNLLCYLIDTSKFDHIDEMKQILIGFAEKIDIINMNDIPMKHKCMEAAPHHCGMYCACA